MSSKATILCVDDDEDDLLLIKETIRSRGTSLEIIEAKNGWEAIRYLKDSVPANQLPDLIILDMNMPKMDGRQTIKTIRQEHKLTSIPIVLFTTSASDSDRIYYESQGIQFITKPSDYHLFVKKVIELLSFYRLIQ